MYRLALIVILAVVCAACTPSGQVLSDSLPSGDAAAGEALFYGKIGGLQECTSCHTLDGTNGIGPTLLGYGEIAAERRPGEDATTYTSNSIVIPGLFVVRGYSNVMPPTYAQHLTRQQLSDLIAFVLAQ